MKFFENKSWCAVVLLCCRCVGSSWGRWWHGDVIGFVRDEFCRRRNKAVCHGCCFVASFSVVIMIRSSSRLSVFCFPESYYGWLSLKCASVARSFCYVSDGVGTETVHKCDKNVQYFCNKKIFLKIILAFQQIQIQEQIQCFDANQFVVYFCSKNLVNTKKYYRHL